MTVEAKAPLEAFLAEVRRGLAGLSAEETQEVLRELRSHVLDRVGEDASADAISAALSALGDARELARLNLACRLAARGAERQNPWALLRLTARVARVSLGGLAALVLSLFGYLFAVAWILVALAKPIVPRHVGLWIPADPMSAFSFVLGVTSREAHGTELLGWWIIPVGLILGAAAARLTFRYSRWSLRRLARPVITLPMA
jgi:uncharacterized membrane protein